MARLFQLPPSKTIDDEIVRMRELATPEARTEWRRLTGKPVSRGLKGELLARSLAHLLQEKAHGALSPVWARRLATMAKEATEELARAATKDDKGPVGPSRRQIKPGSRLVREWQGALHEVVVVADGYLWNGVVFTSLSSIAKEITGTSWNGWTFFGISQPKRRLNDPQRSARPARSTTAGESVEAAHG